MAVFLRTVPEALAPKKTKKKRYADVLRASFPKHGLRGGQTVPMDIDKIRAALTAANS